MNRNETPLLERSYHIPLELFDTAFRTFQKKYVYPKNIAITLILAAIAGVYVHAALTHPEQTLSSLLLAICIGMIFSLWYKMFKLRRSVHDALKEVGQDVYRLKLFADGMLISTEDAKSVEKQALPEEKAPELPAEKPEGNGFAQIFPEEPAEANEPIPPTEIAFGSGVKITDCGDYFMVYLIRQNFYVIPKKDFSDAEIKQMQEIFKIN